MLATEESKEVWIGKAIDSKEHPQQRLGEYYGEQFNATNCRKRLEQGSTNCSKIWDVGNLYVFS